MFLFLHPSVGNTKLCLWFCYRLHLKPSSFLANLDGEILRHCARLWFLYVYFCNMHSLSFCCSDTPYAAYRNISQVQTVLSYRCLSSETYNICHCWLNSLISITRTICWSVQEVLCHWEIASRNSRFECTITKCASYAKEQFLLVVSGVGFVIIKKGLRGVSVRVCVKVGL